MTTALITIFVLVYLAVAMEEPLRINKAGAALIGAGTLWTVYSLGSHEPPRIDRELAVSLVSTAQIAFFLIGAMAIVEVVDSHDGFEIFTARIRTASFPALAWKLGAASFFLSAVLDNLTTAIVMVSLLSKLAADADDRRWLAALIIIAANAGGSWSPIGDVTTTMLWIGGQVTTVRIVTQLILPAIANAVVPLAIVTLAFRRRRVTIPESDEAAQRVFTTAFERNLMFGLGLAVLLAVPVFRALTTLPPFMGVLFGLGILWVVGDWIHRDKREAVRTRVTIAHALTRIDMSAIVFLIGILLAVATLEHAGVLAALARWLLATFGRLDAIVLLIGLGSAVIDNVPMVAAAMGMFDLASYPPDSFVWEFLAYCAGTGGSILVIGSAAGVAAMGIERIGFLWYARRIGPLALAGYLAGAGLYLLQVRAGG